MVLYRALPLTAAAAALLFVSTAPLPGVSAGLPREAEQRQAEASKTPCCFQNPGYAGTCKVQPAEDETCASILAYLNNPMAEGKSYCGGTTVRQGWAEVPCEKEGGDSRQ